MNFNSGDYVEVTDAYSRYKGVQGYVVHDDGQAVYIVAATGTEYAGKKLCFWKVQVILITPTKYVERESTPLISDNDRIADLEKQIEELLTIVKGELIEAEDELEEDFEGKTFRRGGLVDQVQQQSNKHDYLSRQVAKLTNQRFVSEDRFLDLERRLQDREQYPAGKPDTTELHEVRKLIAGTLEDLAHSLKDFDE